MEKKKTSTTVLLIIMGVLILAELAITASAIIVDAVSYLPILISLVFVSLYGFWFYKKPHGNMLKYAMLLFAITQILARVHLLVDGNTNEYIAAVEFLCAGMVIYVAGRLNRIEQNKYILAVVTIIAFICGIADLIPDIGKNGFIVLFTYLYEPIMLLTLMIAYFVRYNEHREAGLMDAPKK